MKQLKFVTQAALLFLLVINGARCLRFVELEIITKDPSMKAVNAGSTAVLRCNFELDPDEAFDSIKWYRDETNFYDYNKDDEAPKFFKQVYKYEVNWSRSNKSQVALQNVKLEQSGNYSCEVTVDSKDPEQEFFFRTSRAYKQLHVISVPESKPVIKSSKTHYKPGDTLKVDCSWPSSTPPANITFTLNDMLDMNGTNVSHKTKQEAFVRKQQGNSNAPQQISSLTLKLGKHHFSSGQLSLSCNVRVYQDKEKLYETTNEVQLGQDKPREPKTSKVTFPNSSKSMGIHRVSNLMIIGLMLLHLKLR